MLNDYWNCSKFADTIRGTPKPDFMSRVDWDEWHEMARTAHPVRYWIAESFLGYSQKILVTYPNDFKYFIKNYFFNRKDIISSNGLLKRGHWYDTDTRINVCIMEIFCEFMNNEMFWIVTNMTRELPIRYELRELFKSYDKRYSEDHTMWTDLYDIYCWWQDNRTNWWDDDILSSEEFKKKFDYVIKCRGAYWT